MCFNSGQRTVDRTPDLRCIGVSAKTALIFAVVTWLGCGLQPCLAGGFTFEIEEPRVVITIPSLPQIDMDDHPVRAKGAHLRYFGSSEGYVVSIMTPTADAGMSPLECASSILGSLGDRPGVPARSEIYNARINDRTFIAIYVSRGDGVMQLNAHLVSAAAGTHCIEVHASRLATSPDDVKVWRNGFGAADIKPR